MVRFTRLVCVLIVLTAGSASARRAQAVAVTADGPLAQARAMAASGKHRAAVAVLAAAIADFARAGNRVAEAEAELLRGTSLRALADRDAAARAVERALSLSNAADIQVRGLTQLARLHSDAGRENEAAVLLQRAW